MKSLLRDTGLTIVLMGMFVASLIGMVWSGHLDHNAELRLHGEEAIDLITYLSSGVFLSALFENWESEFLQMAVYVVLTAVLFQRGSAESCDPDDPDRPGDKIPDKVRKAGPALAWLYAHSLGLSLMALFIISAVLHFWSSLAAANAERSREGGMTMAAGTYLADPQFWFESFQNWQSEFLSTAVLVVLSIFLRHKGSPESKPVSAANRKTGA